MSHLRLHYLYQLINSGLATQEEHAEFLSLLSDQKYAEDAEKLLNSLWSEFDSSGKFFELKESKKILNNILQSKNSKQKNYSMKTSRWKSYVSIAATLLLIFFLGFSYKQLSRNDDEIKGLEAKEVSNNFTKKAGKSNNKAVLTLGDGSKVILDDANQGPIVNKLGIKFNKTAEGQIILIVDDQNKSVKHLKSMRTQINTISTSKGGQYQINLPDGSEVLLNTESSFRFPSVFSDSSRVVELIGEAYFNISSKYHKGKKVPFKVISNAGLNRSQEIEVLGTQFNINAYENEVSTKVTLVNGKVKVISKKTGIYKILSPGQQSVLNDNKITDAYINLDEVLAWKKGDFMFNKTPLKEVMKQLERWYDIKVDYNKIPLINYHGRISKSENLAEVLGSVT